MKNKVLIFGFIICSIALGLWAASNLRFETDVSTYNLASNEEITAYNALMEHLRYKEGGESIVVLEKASGWSTFEDFLLLAGITAFWQAQPEVVKASSITGLVYPKKGFLLPQSEPFLDLNDRSRFEKRMDHWEHYADITGKFISKNKRYALLFMEAPGGIARASAQQLKSQQPAVEAHYIQYDLIQDELQSTLRRDTIVLALLGLCLILAGFYVFTRSLSGLGLIALMVAFNVAVTFLAMYALAMQFTLHMVAIPCIIAVLSFTDIMHIMYHQQLHFTASGTDSELREQILAAVRMPLFLTSFTNIVGFLFFLAFSRNVHLFNFSLAAIIGVTVAYLSARFLVIRLMDKRFLFIKRNDFRGLFHLHSSIFRWFWKRQKVVFSAFVMASVVLVVQVASHFAIGGSGQEWALPGSRLTRGSEILQAHFFGAKQAEVIIRLKKGSIWDKTTLAQLEQIETAVRRIFQPLFIDSPVVLARRYHRYISRGHSAAYYIPEEITPAFAAQLSRHQAQLGGTGIIDTAALNARMVFGFSLPEARDRYEQLRTVLDQMDTPSAQFELSGLQYLSDEATHRFSIKILIGLVLSILAGSLFVLFVMRSVRKSIGLLLVNLVPMLAALGLMLYMRIPIAPLSLFLLSILLGICVDDSVYLISQYRKGSRILHIVPIFITSIVLSLGFLSLSYSSFKWLQPFGWIFLPGISLAYVLDIFVLPLFLNREVAFGDDA